jgi:2-polyprenyl-6-methoxyphenol hydroxylase-like FAD-dependent oxidoreductase
MPRTVVIVSHPKALDVQICAYVQQVGGSLAGLMHGVLSKRQGVDVTILEQDPSWHRVGNEAGIGFSENVSEFLKRFDVTDRSVAIDCQATKFAWRKNQDA